MSKRISPIDVLKGAGAGAIGTAAMDLLWYRRNGGDQSFAEWEFSTDAESFDDVGAPAQVAKKLAERIGLEIPPGHAGTANDVVHWLTGINWGIVAAVLVAGTGIGALPGGVVTGTLAFGSAYALLGAAGIYKPIWEYDAAELRDDLTGHLLFGVVTGVALAADRRAA